VLLLDSESAPVLGCPGRTKSKLPRRGSSADSAGVQHSLMSRGLDALALEQVEVPWVGSVMRSCASTPPPSRDELEWPLERLPAIPSYELSGVVAAVAPDLSEPRRRRPRPRRSVWKQGRGECARDHPRRWLTSRPGSLDGSALEPLDRALDHLVPSSGAVVGGDEMPPDPKRVEEQAADLDIVVVAAEGTKERAQVVHPSVVDAL
jgi:hypothetical protein